MLLNLVLVQDFDGHDALVFGVDGTFDFAKRAFAQGFADFILANWMGVVWKTGIGRGLELGNVGREKKEAGGQEECSGVTADAGWARSEARAREQGAWEEWEGERVWAYLSLA